MTKNAVPASDGRVIGDDGFTAGNLVIGVDVVATNNQAAVIAG